MGKGECGGLSLILERCGFLLEGRGLGGTILRGGFGGLWLLLRLFRRGGCGGIFEFGILCRRRLGF